VQTLFTQLDPAPHGVHADVHRLLLVSEAHVLSEHMWKPVLQADTQDVPLQLTVPFAGAVQVVHDGPQAATVLLATQVGAAVVPRRQKPGVLQTTRQLSVPGVATLSHAAMPLAGGAGQAVHDVPHELMLVFAMHVPVPAGQRWYPDLQAVPH
jgi:hypothetical protein